MRFYEPIAVGLFVVTVLAASYMLGKRMGYEIGYAQGFERANTDAFAEGHISGYKQAMNSVLESGIVVEAGIKSELEIPQTPSVATN